MQFFKIAAYVQVANYIALWHYAACVFLPYIHGLRLALVSVAGQAVYAVLACMGI